MRIRLHRAGTVATWTTAMIGLTAIGSAHGMQPAYSSTIPASTIFNGTPAIGPLYTYVKNTLSRHCTASVVHSPAGNLLITAAHCVSGRPPSQLVFVPGYYLHKYPYGRWQVTRVYVDQQWSSSGNVNDDVAFLTVRNSGGKTLEQRVGSAPLVVGAKPPINVVVVGYNNTFQRPVRCAAPANPFVFLKQKPPLLQMIFKCSGYYAGTSGGPFLENIGKSYPHGEVAGVIGGYHKGGWVSEISYSPQFGANIAALYSQAVTRGGR